MRDRLFFLVPRITVESDNPVGQPCRTLPIPYHQPRVLRSKVFAHSDDKLMVNIETDRFRSMRPNPGAAVRREDVGWRAIVIVTIGTAAELGTTVML